MNNKKGMKSLNAKVMNIASNPGLSVLTGFFSSFSITRLIIKNPESRSKKIAISKKARRIKTILKTSALKYAAANNITAARIKKNIITMYERFLK